MSDATIDRHPGDFASSRGVPDAADRAFVIARLGRFPFPAIAKMSGLPLSFVRQVADDVDFTPSPRVTMLNCVVFPERGSREPIVHEWRPSLPPNARQAIQAVCERHGLTLRDLMVTSLQSNRRIYAWARQEAYSELLELGYSSPRIGVWFDRDHSTVLSGVERHKERSLSPVSTTPELGDERRSTVEYSS